MNHQDIYTWLDACAPFGTQAGFDNSGFLVGNPEDETHGILFALDVTPAVIQEAITLRANLIVTHHPLMFSPVQRLLEKDYEGDLLFRLIRSGISLISAHTNLDQAPGGINDVLAQKCGMVDVTGDMYLRVGDLARPMSLSSLVGELSSELHTVIRVFGTLPETTLVRRIGVSSGAGSEFWSDARAMGAQVFLTGEIRHHHGLAMVGSGMVGLEAGHFATEEPGIFALADRLSSALQSGDNAVECPVFIAKTATGAYPPVCLP